MIKDQFKIWEEGGGWNKDFALRTAEFSPDIIQKFEKGKLLKATSKAKPDKKLWPHIHQAYSRKSKPYSNDYLKESLKTLICK